MPYRYYKPAVGIFVFITAIIVYMLTLAPTVWFIDSGELAAVTTTLGIAHPTGYPLFTLIGHIFTMLPFSPSQVYKLNIMNAFFCALAVFMFSFLMHDLLSYGNPELSYNNPSARAGDKGSKQKRTTAGKQPDKDTKLSDIIFYGLITFSCLILTFSRTFWGTTRSGKVYPMHVFFIITLILVFLRAINKDASVSTGKGLFSGGNKYYVIFAFVLGLSFTNHLTTLLLAPACLTLFIVQNYKDKTLLLKLLGMMAIFFIIGFSVYLYLPIRTNMHPIFNWGNPNTLERFIWHFSAKQFSIWIFSGQGSVPTFLLLIGSLLILTLIGIIRQKTLSSYYHFVVFVIVGLLTYLFLSSNNEIVVRQFKLFTDSLWNEYGIGLVILALPGVYRLSRFNLKVYYFMLLTFFGCIFYSVNYDIYDINAYFLLAYITLAVWIGFGALYIYEKIKLYFIKNKQNQLVFVSIIILISLVGLRTNYEVNDESNNYNVEQFTFNMFNSVEPNGIVLSSQWDFWISPSWYYHFVKNIRPDIIVVDKELMRRSWYYIFLQHNYPEFYNNSKPEIDKFLAELYKFEHNLPYEQNTIMDAFKNMLTGFVINNPTRKFYTSWEIEQNKNETFATNYVRIPDGLVFRYVNQDSIQNNSVKDYKMHDIKFTPTSRTDYYNDMLMTSYAMMLTNSATYLLYANRPLDAKKYVDLALSAKPNYIQALELKRKFNL